MSSRLRTVAGENQTIAETGRYVATDGTEVRIDGALAAAVAATRCVGPEEPLAAPAPPVPPVPPVPSAPPAPFGDTVVTVTGEGSLTAARRLAEEGSVEGGTAEQGSVAVLNFASARNVGGGYLGGARAQEEDLCRQSLLYHCLLEARDYYDAHRASDDLLYSDRVIWSPAVPVHRGDRGELLARPLSVSFLTSPAPNAGALLRRDPSARPRIREALARRSGRVLGVAAQEGARQLVLGAWGCGVFQNDPREVAEAFAAWLAPEGAFHGVFERVVFAVWDRSEPSANRRAFDAVFAAPFGRS